MSDEVRVIEPGELPQLRSDWETLWGELADASPFQSPAWLLPWAETYAPARCRAAGLWRDGRLAALVPGFVWDGAVLLAGTGPSDHAGVLFGEGSRASAAALLRALAGAVPEPFDRIDLQQFGPESPLASVELPGFSSESQPGSPCLTMKLSGCSGMNSASKRTRDNWRYSMRRLEREGAVIEAVAPEQAQEAAAELEELHTLRWREQDENGVIADTLASQHLKLAIPQLASAGLLRMVRVRLDGQTIAILFAMRGARSTCYYLSGFDPQFGSLSPGTALVGTAIAEAAREGCAEFDFLRGNEDYKRKWGATERPTSRRVLTRL